MPLVRLRVDPSLRFLLRPDRRQEESEVAVTATDTVGHVVRMVGIPLTETGELRLDGPAVTPQDRFRWEGALLPVLAVGSRPLPQPTRSVPPRFLLDVHLGSLTRRLRLLGLDTAYEVDAADAHLVERAVRERRVLLSRDRGLLSRTALTEGALVRSHDTQAQLEEVLRRFVPRLAPWTRCVRCNGTLVPTDAAAVVDALLEGTRRTYREFSRCTGCGRVYWRGAHSGPLESVVRRAEEVLDQARQATPRPPSAWPEGSRS